MATAEPSGWWLRSSEPRNLERRESWPEDALATLEGVSAAAQTALLLDLEIADVENGAVVVPWERFGSVLRESIELPLRWTTWSPLMLSIDRVSELGRRDFQYRYAFQFGARATAVTRIGYFVRREATGHLYHLDEQTFALVDAMDKFNALPVEERTQERSWLTFAAVKGCAESVGASLDAYLAANSVIVPSQLALDICAHDDGSISFVPKAQGIPDADFREAFLRNSDAHGLYVLDGEDGRRVRVVLSDRHRQVLERMKLVRRLKGAAKDNACSNPSQFFDGLLESVDIEYGPRVIGVGDLAFAPLPSNPSEGGGFFKDAPEPAEDDSVSPRQNPATDRKGNDSPTAITLDAPGDAQSVRIVFRDGAALEEARASLAAAFERNAATVDIQGKTIAVTLEALDALSQPPQVEFARQTPEGTERAAGRRFLLIFTNEEEVRLPDADAAEHATRMPEHWLAAPKVPKQLKPGVRLKQHQLESLLWLQRCAAIPQRHGVLLADDMGLGKTLQILTFLASQIEAGMLNCIAGVDSDRPPWRPVLIVAPLILVENETWLSEIRQFFANDGNLFEPVLILHGSGVDSVRDNNRREAETVVGRPTLSADKLMQYRTVITNYETVVNYQHSLAQRKDGRPIWSAIVTDEAQKYKAMNTKVSVALKAIDADFHIASTGTPVENRLLDLWNIIDTIQPALLGTAAEFSKQYERNVGDDSASAAFTNLRSRLLFGEPHAFLIRRTKAELLDLPKKRISLIRCEMSSSERIMHAELLSVLGKERQAGRHLAVLHKLTQLYQHPALLRGDWDNRPVAELVAESSKIQATLAQLHQIRKKGEKVIVFARHLDTQSLLQRIFELEFDCRVSVINGSTSRGRGYASSSSATNRAKNERKRVLDEFRTAPGFGIVILSPFVAGIGLTITEANHVIHYGRWWNPAVEAQATDRAYRIGQTRDVTVWLPILHDPTGQITETFDECLHALLERKMSLASDFLHPADNEDQNISDLCDRLQTDADSGNYTVEAAPFTARDLERMDPYTFEAAVAALYEAEGYSVILTAKGGDGGADVLAFRSGEALLIQVKHSASRSPVDPGALNDVLAARDVYGARVSAPWRTVVVSNSAATRDTVQEAARIGVELVSGNLLMRRIVEQRVGIGAASACSAQRCASFEEGIRQAVMHAVP